MTSNINHKIKKREKANDVFYTPITLVNQHLKMIERYVDEEDIILDPFYGTGNYYNSYKDFFKKNNIFEFTEIELGLDFFEYKKDVDIIVSNPPYSIIDKVLEKSVLLKPHTISYLIAIHNLTAKRIEYMNNNGYYLDKLYLTKVFKWFGMSVIVIFTKKAKDNCIMFDRNVWK